MISSFRRLFHGGAMLALACAVAGGARAGQTPAPLYKNPSAPIPARVNDLLARMTLEEKVAQMLCIWEAKTAVFDDALQFDEAKAA
jgi:beta-glucosidase